MAQPISSAANDGHDDWFQDIISSDEEPEQYSYSNIHWESFFACSMRQFRSQHRAISSLITEQALSAARKQVGKKQDDVWHNKNMTEPITRPELDAKLETIETRMDGRISRIEAKLDGLKGDVASTRSTVKWMAALIVGTIVATAGLVVTAFDSGRDTAQMAAEARAETSAALSEIRQIVNDLKEARP